MDKIDTMRAFVAVAREGSFTRAAQRLGQSTKVVSKYVQRLEANLDTQLFNRTTRSVSLTDVGGVYLDQCARILEQIDEVELLVQERQTALAGPIRITAPTGFGSTLLTAALLPFMRDHPAVNVELILSDTRIALVEEGFDLAVRVGRLRDSTLMARKLSDMPLIVCASPSYLRENGTPAEPSALATHSCLIDENQADATFWHFQSRAGDTAVKVGGPLRANSPLAVARMAMGGMGITRSPLYTVKDALDDGRLQRILSDYTTDVFGLYAVYPHNRHLTARVRALIDHLAEYFAGTAKLSHRRK